MAKHVIIHLPEVGNDYAEWVVADERGALAAPVSTGTLEAAADAVQGHRSTLVLPGNEVLLAEATVPGGNAGRALQAVPFVLEEQLADDVETLHFALGGKGKEDQYPVAVVGKDTMDTVTEQCVAAGLRPGAIVPETLALPKFDADAAGEVSWTALVDDTDTVVRLNGYKGFATDVDMAGFMLDGAQHDLPEESSASLVVYKTDAAAELPSVPRVDIETRQCENRLSLYASGLANSPSINLLQGSYSPKTQFDKFWKPWRWTGVLLLLLCGVFLVGKWFDYFALTKQEAELDGHIARVFNEALPGAKMVRPKSQITAALKNIGGNTGATFISSLHQIADAVAKQPKTDITSISFRNGRFDIDLTTDALPTLDLLKTAIEGGGSGLSMTVLSTNQAKDDLRSRVRVE
ncbi:MAG: hypothetical protein KTR35_06525 [Gammaproteobacteria bacterium]|nr:hypothetical protein [Gammaproteobacteria bacterium]